MSKFNILIEINNIDTGYTNKEILKQLNKAIQDKIREMNGEKMSGIKDIQINKVEFLKEPINDRLTIHDIYEIERAKNLSVSFPDLGSWIVQKKKEWVITKHM